MNYERAYAYYESYIHRPHRLELLKEYNFSCAGSVSPVDWELFGAMLVNQKKVPFGPDLFHYEIKSTVEKSSVEYQYHLRNGTEKFEHDLVANQVFICYHPNYANVEIRMAHGSVFSDYFNAWQADFEKDIKSGVRFRRSIPYKTLIDRTQPILKIVDGKLA